MRGFLVDASGSGQASGASRSAKKTLQAGRADARTRTGDPFITSEVLYQLSYVGNRPTVAASGPSNSPR